MALVYKGEMPSCCAVCCDCNSAEDGNFCNRTGIRLGNDWQLYKPLNCPIIGEIPDRHGDLIDRGLVQEVLAQLLPLVITNELTDKEIGLVHRTVGAIAEMINEQEVVVEATE